MISVDSSQIQRDPESFPVALHHTTPSVPGPRSDPGPDACRRPSLVHSIPPVRFLLLVGEGMGTGPTQDQTQKEVHKQPPNLLGFWSAFRVVACSESIHYNYDLNSHLQEPVLKIGPSPFPSTSRTMLFPWQHLRLPHPLCASAANISQRGLVFLLNVLFLLFFVL